ncbi:hypothetical protein BD410DRAFT_846315 [Rickenella mellea]|uniref:Uncharacterized protein n=1 Tax=Rickenella mellea TaxID=50990 RepID=A0A4Y7PH30_9AGAM|nr:hypothetical protein BD410DRAFT_846315 [Rickenella mellea]
MAPPSDVPPYILPDDDARRLSSIRQMLLDAGKHQLMELAMEPEAELKRKIALIPPNDINGRKKLFDEFMGKMQDLARLSEEDVKARFAEEREWSRSLSVGLGNANAGPSRQPRSSVDDGMADLYEALGNMPFLNGDNEDDEDSDGGSSTEGEEDDRWQKQHTQPNTSRRRSGTVGPPLPDSRAAEQRSKSATVSPRPPARPELIATSFSAASHGSANSNVANSAKIQQHQQQQVEPPELSPRRRAQSTSSTRDEFKMFASIAGHHRQPSGGSNTSGVSPFTPTSANMNAATGDHNKHTIWVPPKPAHMQTAPNSSSTKSKHSATAASSAAPSRPTSHASQMSAANSTSSNVSNASNASHSSNISGTGSRSQSQNPQSSATKKSGRARSEDPSERKPEKMNISTSTHSTTGSRQHKKQATDPAPTSTTPASSSTTSPASAASATPTATIPITTNPKTISRDTSQAPSADHSASSVQTSLTLSHAHAQVQAQNEPTPSPPAQASTPTPASQARGSHHPIPQHTPLPTPSQMPAQGLFWTPSSSAADEKDKDRDRRGVRSASSSRSSSAAPKHRATVEDVDDDGDGDDGQAIVETMLSGMWMPPDDTKSKSNGHSAASTPATRSHSNSSASSNAFGFGFTPFSNTTPATSGMSSPPPLPHRSVSNHSHNASYANASSNTHGTAHAAFTALGGFDQSTLRAPSAPRAQQPSLEATFGIGRTVSGSSTNSEKSNVSGVSSSSSGSVSSGGFGGFSSWADLGEKEKEREKKEESNNEATSSSHARWVPGPEKEKEKERAARPLRRTGPSSTMSSTSSNPSASAPADVEIPATQDQFYAMSDVAKTERLRVRRGELKNRAEVVAHYERKMFALMREFAEALNRVEDP